MFEKADPGARLRRTPARLRLRSGEAARGAVLVPAHRSLRDEMNDPGPFLEIELAGKARAFLLKAEIARLDPEPAEPRAARESRDGAPSRFEAEDPRAVLGIGAGADAAEARRAYLALVKAYHPDRLAALGLPDELVAHAGRTLARINAAFERLGLGAAA